jgi:hypothetical protein
MIKLTRIQFNSMKRSKQFVLDHTITPAIPALTAAATALGTSITTIEALDSGWDQGKGTFLGAAEERRFAKTQLRKALSALSLVSKSLDKAVYPDVAAQLKMGNHKDTYQGALAFGRAAVAVVEPIKQVFIDHGSAATVVEDLEALITALEEASNRKVTGLGSRIGKTAALRAEARNGMRLVRVLDGIFSQVYKDNVELLTAWKAAKRQQQPMEDEDETVPASGSGSGEGSQPA